MQLKRSLVLCTWIWRKKTKHSWRKIWGSRCSCGVWQCQGSLLGLFPAAKLPQMKPEPSWSLQAPKESLHTPHVWCRPLGSTSICVLFCPWNLFWNYNQKGSLLFLSLVKQFVWTNAAFIRPTCVSGKKQSNFWAYSPFLMSEIAEQPEEREKISLGFCLDDSNEIICLFVDITLISCMRTKCSCRILCFP